VSTGATHVPLSLVVLLVGMVPFDGTPNEEDPARLELEGPDGLEELEALGDPDGEAETLLCPKMLDDFGMSDGPGEPPVLAEKNEVVDDAGIGMRLRTK
jgi:hypothetical protein